MLSTNNYAKFVKFSCLAGALALLGGCGSSSNSTSQLTVDFSPVKAFTFSWNSDSRAEYCPLLENPDGDSAPIAYPDAPFNSAVKSVEDYIKSWLLRESEVAPIKFSKPQQPTIPEAPVLAKDEFETTKQCTTLVLVRTHLLYRPRLPKLYSFFCQTGREQWC